jgi:PAS domain S-box-containing protein
MIEIHWKWAYFLFIPSINLILSLVVYLRNRRHLVNQLFAISVIWVTLWIISDNFLHLYAGTPAGSFWGKTTFAMASLIPVSFLAFAKVFPSDQKLRRDSVLSTFGAAGIFFFLASFTSLIVLDVKYSASELLLSYGTFYPAFALYFLLCFGTSFHVLWKKYETIRGIERLRMRYLFLGTLTSVVGGITTNLIVPLVFRTSRFSWFGPAFTVFAFAFIAHAIIRHRLMNIHLVIRRSIVYLFAVTIAGSIFISLLWLLTTSPFGRPQNLPLWAEVSLVLFIALLFHPLRRFIQTSLDRYLYREPYNYQHIIREASKTIPTLLDLQSLLRYLCKVIGRTVRPEVASIFIKNQESTGYKCVAFQKYIEDNSVTESEVTLPEGSPLLYLLAQTRAYFPQDDVEPSTSNKVNRDAAKELQSLDGEIVFSIAHEEQLLGFVVLAPKLSGDAYFAEDIDLLSTLTGQAAVAIKNAQLYQEVTLVNEYVANIVATMESGVVAVGANGKITLFNPAAERMTGLGAQSVRSKPVGSLPLTLAQALEATLVDGQPRIQPETTIPDAAGRLTPISYSTYALRDHSGSPLGAVAVFADLTRLKELEAERRRAERLASFGALASGVAHEIKNPLVAIKTFAELLPERFTEEDFRHDFSKVVVREIERIDDLVSRLRGLAAPSAQPLAPLDVREPIEDTLALLRAQLEQKEVRLHRLYDPDLPPVAADPAQLKQLFLNLFMNALEAMESGGELTIELRTRSRHGSSAVMAKVSDTGTGIPDALLGKIFDPFVTTKPRGSGLGLAICRRITDAHGATIRAENNPNRRGSTIAIAFPAVTAMAATINKL